MNKEPKYFDVTTKRREFNFATGFRDAKATPKKRSIDIKVHPAFRKIK